MKMWEVLSAVALIAAVGTAKGETVTLQANYPSDFIGLSSGLTTTVDVGGGHTHTSTTIGAFNWTVQSPGSATFGYPQSIYTFCIQDLQVFDPGSLVTYDVNRGVFGSPTGGGDDGFIDLEAALQIQGLVTRHWDDAFGSDVNAAAFQLAIWEIEYDAGGTGDGKPAFPEALGSSSPSAYFGNGNFTALSSDANGVAAMSLAANWLGQLTDANLPGSVTSAVALNNSETDPHFTQDQLTRVVPLPAALPAGLLMFVGLATARGMRRRIPAKRFI